MLETFLEAKKKCPNISFEHKNDILALFTN